MPSNKNRNPAYQHDNDIRTKQRQWFTYTVDKNASCQQRVASIGGDAVSFLTGQAVQN